LDIRSRAGSIELTCDSVRALNPCVAVNAASSHSGVQPLVYRPIIALK
jgi:hypothetical protein